jgi:MinD-like ATPase involved in chromosome partitioning or flagellar assembly
MSNEDTGTPLPRRRPVVPPPSMAGRSRPSTWSHQAPWEDDPTIERSPSPAPTPTTSEVRYSFTETPTAPDTPAPPAPGASAGSPSPVTSRRALRERESGRVAETADALTAERILRRRPMEPETGWRRAVYRATGGAVHPGESRAVRERLAMELRVAARVGTRARFVPVLTRKGGVGKTTVTSLLGMTMATLREDRVVAVDANPDRGTLAERMPRQSAYTVRDVVQRADRITTFADLSELVARDVSRLDVLASDTDPATAEAFGEDDYKVVADVVARHYSIVLTDCGTGMVHSVMRGTLDLADSLVLVSGASVDEARLASETLTWLEVHGYDELVQNAVVALNSATPSASALDVDEVSRHFESRCRVVVRLPYDPHLAEGATIRLDQLRPETRLAALELAAHVVDGIAEES